MKIKRNSDRSSKSGAATPCSVASFPRLAVTDDQCWESHSSAPRMSSSNRADAEAKTLRDDTVVDETPGDVRPFAWRELDTVHNRDVAQRLTIVLGTAETTSKQLRGLHAGSLVKLGQSVASPVTVFAGPRLVAHAEIVEEHGNLAFRVTRILGTA